MAMDTGTGGFASEPIRPSFATPLSVTARLSRSPFEAQPDLLLWWLIEKSTEALSFNNYQAFIDFVLCGKALPAELQATAEGTRIATEKRDRYEALKDRRRLPFTDTDAYRMLKVATEAFKATCTPITRSLG